MQDSLTLDKLNEAMAIIKALAPKEAPQECWSILSATGLKIVKNDLMSDDTIIVSKRLFDMIYEAAQDRSTQNRAKLK